MVRRVVAIDRRRERLVRASPGVGPDLEDVIEAFVADPLDLGLGERRVGDDLTQQLEGGLEARGRHVDPHGVRVPARVGMERRPEPFGRLDERDRVKPVGPLGERPRRQHGGAALEGRLVRRTVAKDELRADEGSTGQVDGQDAEPVGQDRSVEWWEVIGPRLAWRRPGGDHHGRSVLGHAAVSSSDRSASSAPSGSAGSSGPGASSAGGNAGMYVITTRLSARKTSAATAWIRSGVTDR